MDAVSLNPRMRGYSLFELMVTVAVIGVLLGTAVPKMRAVLDHAQTRASVSAVNLAMRVARQAAVEHRQFAFLCPLDDEGQCTRDWDQPLSVFISPNRAAELGPEAVLVREFTPPQGDIIYMRPGNRTHFRYNAMGQTPGFIGHVAFCPTDPELSSARIIISMGGRTRVEWEDNDAGCTA